MDLRERSSSVALAVGEKPVVVAALGAMCIASSGVLVRLASSSPVTVAFFRCLYALPLLGLVTYVEKRRFGPLPQRTRTSPGSPGCSSPSTSCSGTTPSTLWGPGSRPFSGTSRW